MHPGTDPTGEFATAIQRNVATLQTQHPIGWIVDLRGNRGGNMWPMLAGIGPLLGVEKVGEFLDISSKPVGTWHYADGRAWLETPNSIASAVRASGTPVIVSDTSPVALLMDEATGSSGEAIAIAFCGRARTRFFGVRSGASASSPRVWPLSDGAQIMLADAALADRNGRTYMNGVVPDEVVTYASGDKSEDSQITAALRWLALQSSPKLLN